MTQVTGMICPKCGGQHIFAGNKGFSGAKALGGAVLTGGIGLLAGVHGSKRVRLSCISCGYSWVPEEELRRENLKRKMKPWNRLALVASAIMIAFIIWILSLPRVEG